MASLQVHENLAVSVDVQSECLGNPSLCHQGLSLGFWLRHKRKYEVSRLLVLLNL